MRVLLFMVFFVIPLYSFFKGRLRVGGGKSFVRFALFCIWGPHKFSIFGESGSSSRLMTQASFIATCLLNANRLPIPYCALRSQHLLSQMYSLSIIPAFHAGAFSKKSTFIKISLPLHLPNPSRVKDQGRTKDEPKNTQRTPNHPKVLFIKIGYLKEIFVTVASAICLPCQIPLSISFTPLCKVSLHSRTSAKISHR